jgi:tetratricopeptide (TPR) repeat protein
MILRYLTVFTLWFGAFSFQSAIAQEEAFHVDKAELDLERVFLDAMREKMLRNYDKALGFLNQVLEKDPQNAAVMYEKARVLEAQNNNQEALDWALKAVNKDLDNHWFQIFLADLYQKLDRPLDAASVYERLVNRFPNNEQYNYKWAYFLIAGNQVGQAITVYENMERRVGVNEELSRRKHVLFLGIGDLYKAEQELLHLINSYPTVTEYLHLLAGFYEQTGQEDKALDVYKRVEVMNPFDSKASLAISRLTRGVSSSEVGYLRSLQAVFIRPEFDLDEKIRQLIPFVQAVAVGCEPELAKEVLQLCHILVEVHSNEAKVYAIRGDVHFHLSQLQEAAADYEKTLELNRSVFQVWEQLLYTYMDLGYWEKLYDKSELALSYFPNQASLYYFNALGLARKGEPSEALEVLEQASFMIPANSALKIEVLSLQGSCLARTGQLDKAAKTLKQAINQGAESSAVVLEQYGDVLFQLGDSNEAVSYWQKALKQSPESEILKRKIADKRLYE